MTDKGKVIDGLEMLRFFNQRAGRELWADKPHDIQETDIANADAIYANAIAMLKEQEAKTQGGDSGMCEICSFYERAMSVKPHYNARTNWYECGVCHYSMTSGMHCKGELIPAYKVGFCAKCGKAVMWE